jgi:hypothetical protein
LLITVLHGCKKDDKAPPTAPSVTTAAITNLGFYSATGGGTITADGGATITASGICWSNTNNTPTINDSLTKGTTTTGSFTSVINNLKDNTTYYVRAYATNSAGTGYGNVIQFSTVQDTTKVTFTYNGQTVTYGVIVSPTTGRKWMDRNLGASRVATSATDTAAYGDYFQWGRLDDGHQKPNSDISNVMATSNTPTNNKFIIVSGAPNDWRNPPNDNLWQGTQGNNIPCPAGWHVPTAADWIAETGITNGSTAYSQLKLTLGGIRYMGNGVVYYRGDWSYYWSTAVVPADASNSGAFYLSTDATTVLLPNNSGSGILQRANGMSVRCIKN